MKYNRKFVIIALGLVLCLGVGVVVYNRVAVDSGNRATVDSGPSPDERAKQQVFFPLLFARSSVPTPMLSPIETSTSMEKTPMPTLPPPPLPKPSATPTAPVSPIQTELPPPTPTELPPPVPKPAFGVQVDFSTDDPVQVLDWAKGLGFGWVKVQVEWSILEKTPGHYRWVELDRIVKLTEDAGLKLLLSIVDAPEWLRAEPGYNGPPEDPSEFGRLMGVMGPHYMGRVAAYELWNEPNLAREWYGETLDPAAFVTLVSHGSRGIRETDPNALVISGGPAVTGIDDGVTAIDDRRFLREALDAGLARWVDGIGVHPYGYGNPPGERAADAAHQAPAWNDHPSFFFLDTLEDYHAILNEAQVSLPLWPTEFGWPAAEGIDTDLPEDFPYPYAAWISEAQQADYLVHAGRLMQARDWVGPFFIWNLNISVNWGADRPESLFSLLRPDGTYRPAYIALRTYGP